VVYSGTGIALFYLLSSIKYFLLCRNLFEFKFFKYCYLCVLVFQVAVIFIFADIVLQNWGSHNIRIDNFVMRYQAIGGLIGVELGVLRHFFATFKVGRL
jgi:hypothetical protein